MSEEQYAREQAALNQGNFGDEDEEDFHIEIPKVPEVNPEVYRDVEPMLFRGFLYVPATINGVSFVFKSLNHHEFEHLSFLDFDTSRKGIRKSHDLFLAHCVLMIDGTNVLPDRENWIHELAKFFGGLDNGARQTAIHRLSEINRRANRAVILTEAYATEQTSRFRWAQLKGIDLMSPAATGFVGTERIGMNWAQFTWRAINYFEDQKEIAEREWENAKFVASAMAGKGMSKVHSQDRQRRKKDIEERSERKDRILRFALLGEPLDTESRSGGVLHVARTVEELSKQLAADLKGEKDWHDMVVENHERQVRDQAQARMDRIREFQKAASEKYGDQPLVGSTETEGLTPDEVQFRLQRRRQLAAQRLAQQAAYPELHDEKQAQFLERWVTPQTPPKALPFKKEDD